MDLKKKIGPLPLWSWIVIIGGTIGIVIIMRRNSSSSSSTSTASQVDPNNPMGLTYAQEAADEAEGVDPSTGTSYASEQSAADQAYTSSGGGGTDSGSTTTTDDTEPTWASGLDTDVQTLSAIVQGGGITDYSTESSGTTTTTPEQSFAGEVGDVSSGLSALQQLEQSLAPTPAASSAPAATPVATAAKTPVVKTSTTTNAAVVQKADAIIAKPTTSQLGTGGSLAALEAADKSGGSSAPKVPKVTTVSGKKATAKG